MNRLTPALLLVAILASTLPAQERGRGGRLSVGVAPVPLPTGPVVFDTAEQHKIRVVVVTKELSHPWGMAWLPNGDLLVTERPGRLRISGTVRSIRAPISGLPPMHVRGLAGLLDVALHPNFATNKLVYFSYVKDGETWRGDGRVPRTARRHDADGRAGRLRHRVVDEGQRSRRTAGSDRASLFGEGRDAVRHVRRSRSRRRRTESRRSTSAR